MALSPEILLPPIPNLDAYLVAYSGWVVDLIGHNLIFFGLLAILIRWVAKKTPWEWDDMLLHTGKTIINKLLRIRNLR